MPLGKKTRDFTLSNYARIYGETRCSKKLGVRLLKKILDVQILPFAPPDETGVQLYHQAKQRILLANSKNTFSGDRISQKQFNNFAEMPII